MLYYYNDIFTPLCLITVWQMLTALPLCGIYSLRCKKWVENCSRSDLKDKTPDHLNKYHRLCARHFEPNLITKTVSCY